MAVNHHQRLVAELESTLAGADMTFGGGKPSAICATVRREEKMQFIFLAIYQFLLLVLSLAAVLLLLGGIWRVWDSAPTGPQVVALCGSLLSGGASTWLVTRVKDARAAHKAAQRLLDKYCKST